MIKYKNHLLPLALLTLFLASCDNAVVPKANYDALLTKNQELVALNDSLQFELSCLKVYVECLEEDNKYLVDEINSIPLIEE